MEAVKKKKEDKHKEEQFNVTFLLDLSDKIDPKISPNTPEHYQRNITIIQQFVSFFLKRLCLRRRI